VSTSRANQPRAAEASATGPGSAPGSRGRAWGAGPRGRSGWPARAPSRRVSVPSAKSTSRFETAEAEPEEEPR
jgi:hypothetical protein